LVISKTGTTLETVTNEALVRDRFIKAKLDPAKHFVSVSMAGSPLDDPKKYLACFHIWDWIGGRYSTTSMVGGVLLSFAFGFDVYWELLRGANAMDKAANNRELSNNLPLLSALLGIWNRNFLNYPTLAIIPYSQALLRFPAHIQQLDMESHGKRIDQHGNAVNFETGPIIWGEPGTNGQHSFFQLIHQGTTVVPLELVGYKESQFQEDLNVKGTTSQQKLLSNLFAQMLALATGEKSDNPNKTFPGNRPTHLLLGKRLTPYSLGALLAFFEHKIAFQGFVWDINSFDQEGVQLGKVLSNKIISRFADPKSQPYPLADVLIKQLETF
jgi:glucose-6-phosphate isomerase